MSVRSNWVGRIMKAALRCCNFTPCRPKVSVFPLVGFSFGIFAAPLWQGWQDQIWRKENYDGVGWETLESTALVGGTVVQYKDERPDLRQSNGAGTQDQ